MDVTIDLTSDEAQNIVKGISYLCRQTGLQQEEVENLTSLGSRLSKQFSKTFNWRFGIGKVSDVFNHYMTKKLNIRIKG